MIKQEDELTKNHNETSKDLVTAMMPEMPENPLCPVRSFQMYLSKLHPKCDSLWQRPCKKEHCSDADIWYYNKTIGQNTIAGFMSNLSHAADLSCIYTNHSIRVSTTTFLKRNKFTDNQIMAITGHKSVNSLQLYQKVAPWEKLAMGLAMNSFLSGENQQKALEDVINIRKWPATAALGGPPEKMPLALPDTPTTSTGLVPADTGQNNDPFGDDTDMMTWLSETINTI